MKIDIIKHKKEKNSKSTAVQCLLLAPFSTTVYDAPTLPDYDGTIDEKVVRVVLKVNELVIFKRAPTTLVEFGSIVMAAAADD